MERDYYLLLTGTQRGGSAGQFLPLLPLGGAVGDLQKEDQQEAWPSLEEVGAETVDQAMNLQNW